MGGEGEPLAVRVGDQLLDPPEAPGGEPARRPVAAGARQVGDLDGVLAVGVGHVRDLAAAAEHLGQPDPDAGGVDDRAGRAVAVRQPVQAAPDGDGAGPAGLVDGEGVDVVGGGHLVAPPADALAAEPHLQAAGAGVGREVVDDPQLARALVDDPPPVAGGVPGVEVVVVGVAAQVGAVGPAGVQVADALVVGEERDPAPTAIGQSRCPPRPASSRLPCSQRRPVAPPRYRFQAAGSCGGFPVRSSVHRSASLPGATSSSVTAMSETGPQGSRRPGVPSVGTV